ncbi:hypothetical protein, partial [Bacillus pseudomycoides]|uniref:hypothetical protein n=1 Tax=Bacillus pseudomycoides TaxID=64104 RepID=UPI000534E5FD
LHSNPTTKTNALIDSFKIGKVGGRKQNSNPFVDFVVNEPQPRSTTKTNSLTDSFKISKVEIEE